MKDKNNEGIDVQLISEKDIINQLQFTAGSSLFLGKYTLKEMFLIIEKIGLVKTANKIGFTELKIDLESPDVSTQRLTIYNKYKNKNNLIVDLLVSIEDFEPHQHNIDFFGPERLKYLTIEWLTLQNPKANFTQEKRKLPGQKFPGLGIKKELYILFRAMGRDLKVDGIQAKPQFFHNAMMYKDYFKFTNPEKEGEFRAVYQKFIEELGFYNLSWAVYENCIKYGFLRKNYAWKCGSQLFPLRKRTINYFNSSDYKRKVEESKKRWFKSLKLKSSCLANISV